MHAKDEGHCMRSHENQPMQVQARTQARTHSCICANAHGYYLLLVLGLGIKIDGVARQSPPQALPVCIHSPGLLCIENPRHNRHKI